MLMKIAHHNDGKENGNHIPAICLMILMLIMNLI